MEKWNYKKFNLITVRSVFKYPQGHEFLCLNVSCYEFQKDVYEATRNERLFTDTWSVLKYRHANTTLV